MFNTENEKYINVSSTIIILDCLYIHFYLYFCMIQKNIYSINLIPAFDFGGCVCRDSICNKGFTVYSQISICYCVLVA